MSETPMSRPRFGRRSKRRHALHLGLISALCCLMAVNGFAASSGADTANPPSTSAARPASCGVNKRTDVLVDSPKTADGYTEAERWLQDANGQSSLDQLNHAVGMDPSVVGLVPDYATRSIVVVYDATAPTAAAVEANVRSFTGAFTVALKKSCHTRASLDAALASINAQDWGPAARSTALAAFVDAETDSVLVMTPADGSGAQQLRAKYGNTVTIEDGHPSLYSGPRNGDLAPHWGGSVLIDAEAQLGCTSGFTALNVYGFRGSLTDAHCSYALAGDHFYSAFSTASQYYFGKGYGNGNYPNQDFQWVFDFGIQYTNVIHTDPCCPSQRSVTAKGDAPLYSTICADGAVTGASCGATVTSTNASLCGGGICIPNLEYAVLSPWGPVATHGDSGGPIYVQSGSSDAIARGLVEGGTFGNDVFFSKVSSIEAAGLTILTSP